MENKGIKGHNDLCVGIDLGTTNSVLATINEKPNGDIVSKVVEISRAVDMYNAVSGDAKLTTMKKPTLPSCVYYRQEKNYEPLVGDFAKIQYPLRPHLVSKSIKSQMGNPKAEDLSTDIPDKTPAQISARILKHMLNEASRAYRCNIDDAVITVPANFDSSMCRATKDAAELAGIKVRNDDGSERPVLLSEPNAVIYDLINQMHNGEISNHILNLESEKRVLVFDLGGGTLDITMHSIKRREDNPEVLSVQEIATNRYTLLGGDDFDEEIAKAMYSRYIKQYSKHTEIVARLHQSKAVIMAQLLVYAEHLKLELNERCGNDYDSGWDDPAEEIEIPTGGNMGGIGYSYDDTFSQQEVEETLAVFMAKDISYMDYKRLDTIKDTKNIIYPILDVLSKASEKLNTENITVDAVIVNGGMSKFYMVTERLKDFFGFEPIVALDPDQAVARGAAVYHYYLHKYEEMKEGMKLVGDSEEAQTNKTLYSPRSSQNNVVALPVQWQNSILNDSLYLGTKNNGVYRIIPTGAELPYTSEVMTGFMLEPGSNRIAIPIKSKNLDNTYRTIASGNIYFKQRYSDGAYVSFIIHMGENKVLTMKAWTSYDEEAKNIIEEGFVEIKIDNSEQNRLRNRFMSPTGSALKPYEEINNIIQLCKNFNKSKTQREKHIVSKRIAAVVKAVCSCGNKGDFAEVILDKLSSITDEETRSRLFTVARRLSVDWNSFHKKQLASICMLQIISEINGFDMGGPKVTANNQAIYALSFCGNAEQMEKLTPLHSSPKYFQSCIYAHSRTGTDVDWIVESLEKDVERSVEGKANSIQYSAYAAGVVMRREGGNNIGAKVKEGTVRLLCRAIEGCKLSNEELASCLLALGWICDQRCGSTDIDYSVIMEASATVKNIDCHYSSYVVTVQSNIGEMVTKMIDGENLNIDEERFLLIQLEK